MLGLSYWVKRGTRLCGHCLLNILEPGLGVHGVEGHCYLTVGMALMTVCRGPLHIKTASPPRAGMYVTYICHHGTCDGAGFSGRGGLRALGQDAQQRVGQQFTQWKEQITDQYLLHTRFASPPLEAQFGGNNCFLL